VLLGGDDALPPGDDEPLPEEDEATEDERARAFLAGGAYATVAIDRYDELPAIFGRIDSASSPRVALVAARGNRELQRALSMRRLQRHLDLTGKDLILVTRSRALRLRAREEGLPAVSTLRRVDFETYGRSGLQFGWLTLRLPSVGILLALVLLVVAVIGGAALVFWYLPRAQVTVYLPTTVQEDVFEFTLDGGATVVDVEKATIPARRREVTVTRSFYRQATGVVQIPTTHAGVALRFTNRTAAAVTVPKGTVAIADNTMRFTIADDVNLPRLNATADVIALAQQPGTVGNVPPGSIRRLEVDAALAQRVTVTNPAPGEKGTDTAQTVISEADVEGVRNFADAVLIDAAKTDLLQRFAESATVFAASASAQITDLTSNPPVGTPAKYAEVKATAKVSMLTADDADLRQLYVPRFRPLIPPERMLLEDEFTTTVERTGEPERTADRLPVTARVQAVTAPLLDRKDLQQALAGTSKRGVETVIRDRVLTPVPPSVKLSPGWVPRLPRRESRIQITYVPAPQG
jgi:hypothetical protein